MGKVKYKISARATILLGREGVSKADGAIVELIKNTYDADAEICFICIDAEQDTIYLVDNGSGMDSKIIEECWMLIGTANKRDNYESTKKRIKSGEKGIGRFALDRLGCDCVMYTKMEGADHTIRWHTDWSEFETTDKNLNEMEADIDEIDGNLENYLPQEVTINIREFVDKINETREDKISIFEKGTIFLIRKLRDQWNKASINKLFDNLQTLLPPKDQDDFFLGAMESLQSGYQEIKNDISEECDYNMKAEFDGTDFVVTLRRNELDLNKIPLEVFAREEFRNYPYRKTDFEKESYKRKITVQELLKTCDEDLIRKVKKLGKFSFNYNFMKLTLRDDSKETFFYKEISRRRGQWLKEFGGIKIYRDNFFVRPYGVPGTDTFDWLGLDARRAKNPAAVSHPGGGLHVRNNQSQGTILISRVQNEVLLDKSSREGIIENEYFSILKNVIISLIAVFERDRAYIGRALKLYNDEVNKGQRAKEEGKKSAEKWKASEEKKAEEYTDQEKMARAIEIYEEEREELLTELQQLKSLATNGLITSTVAHDLKGIKAALVSRVDALKKEIDRKDEEKINRHLKDLKKNDEFLKAWLTVVTTQPRKDKRTRNNYNVYELFSNIVSVLEPISSRKHVNISVQANDETVERKLFKSDFESILYNLIINSIEAFEKSSCRERNIQLLLQSDSENIVFTYKDNGPGLSDMFENPYDIFNYGTTSKVDKEGNTIGTGMGMYIVSSTLREYDANPVITEYKKGFALQVTIRR